MSPVLSFLVGFGLAGCAWLGYYVGYVGGYHDRACGNSLKPPEPWAAMVACFCVAFSFALVSQVLHVLF